MNKKKIIFISIGLLLIIIVGLWIGGIIPKFIARVAAEKYLKTNLPKKQFEYVGIEWASVFDGYIIRFKDEKEKEIGFIMNDKYLPVFVGQGIFVIEEDYRKEFGEKIDNLPTITEYEFVAEIIEVNENNVILKPDANSREIKSGDRISVGITRPTNRSNDFYVVGNKIKITYDGTIMESYPAQINAIKIEPVNENNWDANKVNIKIKEGTLTNNGAKIIITDKNNKPISWGVDFLIEEKKGEQWELVPQKAEITWIAIAMMPNENGISELDCNWNPLYGELKDGTYRIVKNSYSQQYKKVYSEPFTIEN